MEKPISEMATMVNEILTFVRGQAQGMEIGEVERRLLSHVPAWAKQPSKNSSA